MRKFDGGDRDVSSGKYNTLSADRHTYKRGTIYFAPELHQALRLRAASTGETLSGIVNSMVKAALAEEAMDLDGFLLLEEEPQITFETFISDLRRRGRL